VGAFHAADPRLKPDAAAGHGAKTGAFIRLKPRSKHHSVYTPQAARCITR
jgi:hypothetical protein